MNYSKKIHLSTLRNFCTGLFVCCFGFSAIAQTESSSENIPTEKVSKFFENYLKMGLGKFAYDMPLELSEIQETQHAVWDLWVKENANYKESKLIDLQPLKAAEKGSWMLPSRLEPNAKMNYYYGFKGSVGMPEGGFPLFLYLHGSGDRNQEWSTGLNLCQGFADEPSIYFIPQIPNINEYYRWWQKAKQFAWEKLLRLSFVNGKTNPNRVYFFGISEGGYGSQRLASFYADYLAGAGPMAGGEPLINAPVENCANMAFSLLTGEYDNGFFRNTLTQYTGDAFDEMEKAHPRYFVHRVKLIPKSGHSFDYRPTTPWLATYKRNPHPKKVMWENYSMDGIKRKGFYNLYLEKDPSGRSDKRFYYVMNINENEINLDVNQVEYETVESKQGIGLKYKRTYTPATQGIIRIYLNEKLVDFSKPVKVVANGKTLFEGEVVPSLNDMVNSCAVFFDPERVFPASVLIDLSQEGTGIESTNTETAAETKYYDLSGRKISHPQKGIYITNHGKRIHIQ